MRKYIIITFLIFPCIICFTQQSSNDKLLAAKLDFIFSQHFKENEPGGSEYDYGEYPTFTAAGNGGIWSSVEDLKKYVAAMKKCLFLDCNTIAFSQNVWHPKNWNAKDPPSQGFSWFVSGPKNKDEYKVINHSGSQAGFRAHLFIIHEPDITIIWLTNNDKSITHLIMKPLVELGYLK